MPELNTQALILLGIGAAVMTLLVIAIIQLVSASRRSETIMSHLHHIDNMIDDTARDTENAVSHQLMAQREENMRTLQGLNDSLLNTLSNAMQTQNMQFSSIQQQAMDASQALEERQHRMHTMTAENLTKYDQRITQMETMLDQKLLRNEERLEKIRSTLETSLNSLQADNAKKLDEMRQTVDEKLHDTLNKRLSENFSQVSQQLEAVYKSLGEVHSLASGVGDLKKVLTNVKTRGVWGEVQLGALLEQSLTKSQYAQNVAVKPGSQERVEYAVRLPGKDAMTENTVYLPIDSKFPQEDYVRLVDASQGGDPVQVDAAQKALMNAVKTEAKRISGKYIDPPYTTDFAVMFLPTEGLYAEVMRDSTVVEQIQRDLRIVISGPSTLLALLNSLQMGFRTLAIEQRSAEVWKLLGAVKSDFGNFATVLQKTQEKLQQASDTIDSAFVRTRSIEKKLKQVESLDAKEAAALLTAPDGGE